MRIIELTDNGIIPARYSNDLGGEFNLPEKLQLLGVGSPKLIYGSGLIAFDQIKNINQDVNYTSIELLKHGIAIRFKKRNKFLAALIPTKEIQKIDFEAFKIRVHYRHKEQLRYAADIEIKLNDEVVSLSASPLEYERVKTFFSKRYFSGLYNFKESTLPPVADEDKEWRNILITLIEKIG